MPAWLYSATAAFSSAASARRSSSSASAWRRGVRSRCRDTRAVAWAARRRPLRGRRGRATNRMPALYLPALLLWMCALPAATRTWPRARPIGDRSSRPSRRRRSLPAADAALAVAARPAARGARSRSSTSIASTRPGLHARRATRTTSREPSSCASRPTRSGSPAASAPWSRSGSSCGRGGSTRSPAWRCLWGAASAGVIVVNGARLFNSYFMQALRAARAAGRVAARRMPLRGSLAATGRRRGPRPSCDGHAARPAQLSGA